LSLDIVRHPYELFYLIWRLSWLFGTSYGDVSICYERLCAEPDKELTRLMRVSGIVDYDLNALRRLIDRPRSRWPHYAPAAWFEEREACCESVLQQALAAAGRASAVDGRFLDVRARRAMTA
jgi:hypothetical protein